VLLALSTSCRYCRESASFYRALAQSVDGAEDLVAVFPQGQAEVDDYLRDASVYIHVVPNLALVSLGVSSTPTLMLLSSTGVVQDVWMGRLNGRGQQEVLAKLRGLQ
jgi:hypothetical protein